MNLEEDTGEMCRSAHIKLELREFQCAPVDFLFHCAYVLVVEMQHMTSLLLRRVVKCCVSNTPSSFTLLWGAKYCMDGRETLAESLLFSSLPAY